ncbi:hypothetical protein EGW08_021221, partial [Elysia chlorotica]
SVTLLPATLFRGSYLVTVVDLLAKAKEIYVVVIARTIDSRSVEFVSETGVTAIPDFCEDVSGTEWSGCYHKLVSATAGAVYRVQVDPRKPDSSGFGAYIFAKMESAQRLLCYQLGLPALTQTDLEDVYDYAEFEQSLKSKPICEAVAAPPAENASSACEATTASPASTPGPLTSEQLENVLEEITTRLTVPKAGLSSVKRTKVSVPDHRVSSTSMGYFSLVFIAAFLGLVIVSDLRKLFVDMRIATRNIRAAFGKS